MSRARRPVRTVVEVDAFHGVGACRGRWDLTLDCGHRVTRPMRYLSITHRIPAPPPETVMCRACRRVAS